MKTLEELAAIRAKMLEQVSLRKDDCIDTRVVVGMATCGIAAGARPVMLTFIEELKRIRVQENADMSALLKRLKRNKTILLRGLWLKDGSTVNTFNESIFQK